MSRLNGLNCDTILEKLDEIENQKVIITSLEMNNEKLSNAIEEKEAEIQTIREQLKQFPDETKTTDMKEIEEKEKRERLKN